MNTEKKVIELNSTFSSFSFEKIAECRKRKVTQNDIDVIKNISMNRYKVGVYA